MLTVVMFGSVSEWNAEKDSSELYEGNVIRIFALELRNVMYR